MHCHKYLKLINSIIYYSINSIIPSGLCLGSTGLWLPSPPVPRHPHPLLTSGACTSSSIHTNIHFYRLSQDPGTLTDWLPVWHRRPSDRHTKTPSTFIIIPLNLLRSGHKHTNFMYLRYSIKLSAQIPHYDKKQKQQKTLRVLWLNFETKLL